MHSSFKLFSWIIAQDLRLSVSQCHSVTGVAVLKWCTSFAMNWNFSTSASGPSTSALPTVRCDCPQCKLTQWQLVDVVLVLVLVVYTCLTFFKLDSTQLVNLISIRP